MYGLQKNVCIVYSFCMSEVIPSFKSLNILHPIVYFVVNNSVFFLVIQRDGLLKIYEP